MWCFPIFGGLLSILPEDGTSLAHLPMVAGAIYARDGDTYALEVFVNGRDVSYLFLPPGDRRNTLLRIVTIGREAFAELDKAQGIQEGANLFLFRLRNLSRGTSEEETRLVYFTPGPVRVQVQVRQRQAGGTLTPLPSRLHVTGLDGTPTPNFSPLRPDLFAPRDRVRSFVNLHDGKTTLYLADGRYQLLASRGLRFSTARAVIDVSSTSVTLVLDEVAPTPGVIAADFHVHSIASGDSAIPLRMRLASLMATDLDLAVMTDHNSITDLRTIFPSYPGAANWIRTVPGMEASMARVGHYNIWPLTFPQDRMLLEARDFRPQVDQPARLFDLAGTILDRPRPPGAAPGPRPEGLISLNHPLGIVNLRVPSTAENADRDLVINRNVSYFTNIDYDPGFPVPESFDPNQRQPNDLLRRTTGVLVGSQDPRDNLGFDLMEIFNRTDFGLYLLTRDIWFSWLNQGIRRFALGNTDSHTIVLVRPGMPRNMVMVQPGQDRPATLDTTEVNRALAAGRSYISTGPLLEVTARAAGHGGAGHKVGLGETLSTPDGKIILQVKVMAAPWVPVEEARIFINGEVAVRVPLSRRRTRNARHEREPGRPVIRLQQSFPLELPSGGWLVVEAGFSGKAMPGEPVMYDGDYGIVAPDLHPLAITNPIFIAIDP